jgi:predicted metalloprotease with PDZ domain
MAAMFAQCEREHRGLTAAEIEAACSTAAGHDLDAFFAACVRGTSVPDYRAILGAAGVDLALEERTEKVLRGLDLTHDRPAFTDLRALDQSGGGDPAAITGHVQKLGERAVASVAEAKEDVETAVAAGATSLAVEFARGNGTIATAPAAVEERRRVRVNLTPQNEPAPPAQAIRDGLTRSRRAR